MGDKKKKAKKIKDGEKKIKEVVDAAIDESAKPFIYHAYVVDDLLHIGLFGRWGFPILDVDERNVTQLTLSKLLDRVPDLGEVTSGEANG